MYLFMYQDWRSSWESWWSSVLSNGFNNYPITGFIKNKWVGFLSEYYFQIFTMFFHLSLSLDLLKLDTISCFHVMSCHVKCHVHPHLISSSCLSQDTLWEILKSLIQPKPSKKHSPNPTNITFRLFFSSGQRQPACHNRKYTASIITCISSSDSP